MMVDTFMLNPTAELEAANGDQAQANRNMAQKVDEFIRAQERAGSAGPFGHTDHDTEQERRRWPNSNTATLSNGGLQRRTGTK
jgi:hypothetical protein